LYYRVLTALYFTHIEDPEERQQASKPHVLVEVRRRIGLE
jgi:hypothetical protein